MEATPGNSPPKRARAKATAPSPDTKPARKAAAPRKKPVKEPEREIVEPEIVSKSLTETDLQSMIATAAFYRAAARNFEPGHDLQDWLEAEREIRALYA